MKIQKNQEYSYQVGNYLALEHPTYVRRSADKELFNALKKGEYCYVLSSPQTGKSSLKIRTIQLLQAENIICIALDMTRVNNKLLTIEEWYEQIILTLEKTFLFPRHFPELWWEEMAYLPGDERLFIFIEEVLLVNTQNEKIVIFIDEVNDESVVNSGFSSLGVLIDYCIEQRTNNPKFQRLTFALLGTTIPDNLIDRCRYIELNSFKKEEVAHLAQLFKGIVKKPLQVIEKILYWSGGQPFLTQKLCQIAIDYLGERRGEENYNEIALIEDLVKICVIENWDSQDYPIHFNKIQNLLLKNIQKSTSHLEIYQQILKHGRLRPPGQDNQKFKNDAIANHQWEIKELLKSGVAKVNHGFLEVYSPIYAEIFDREWVQQYLPTVTNFAPQTNPQILELNDREKISLMVSDFSNEEGRRKKEEGRNKKWIGTQTLTNYQNPVDGGVLNPKEKDNKNNNSNEIQVQQQHELGEITAHKNQNNFHNIPLKLLEKQQEKPVQKNQNNPNNIPLKLLEKQQEKPTEKINNKVQKKQIVRKKVKTSSNQQNKLKLGVAGLVIVSITAMTVVGWATKLFKDTQNQLQRAEYQLEKAQYELQEAQEGTKLEHKGITALRKFEIAEIEALLSAMQAGKELKELVGGDRPLQYYPATSPIFALQQILNNIHEKNQIPNVKKITMSPDGQLLATVNNDGTAKILKYSGQSVAQLRGHQGKVSHIKFSPEGNILATAGDDSTVRIWDFLGKQQVELKGHEGQIWQITFSPDGKYIATAGEDGTARIWNISGKKIATLKKHQGRILDVTFSPDGKYIATAGWDGTARIWNRSGRQLARLRGHKGSVEKVIFSTDGQRLATAGWDGTIRVWRRSSGKLLTKLKGGEGGIWNVSFSPDGKSLATAGEDGSVAIWDTSGQVLSKLPGHQGIVTSVSFSPDGERLATAGSDGSVKIWNNNGNLLANLRGHQGRVWEVNFNADGQRLLTLGEDGTGRIWSLEGNHETTLQGNSDIFGSVSFSSNSQKLATAAVDGTARIWDISGKPLAQFNGYLGMFGDMSFSPDGQRLATAGDSGQGRIWKISGEELIELKGKKGRAKQIGFSPDGQRLATVGEDGVARIWNNSGQQLAESKGHNGRVLDVVFSPDGQYIGTAGEDGIAKIWDSSFQLVSELKILSSWVESMAFSPSGKYIVTGDSNGVVKIWDFSGNQIADLKGNIGSVNNLTFSADGEQVASMGKDGMVRIWDITGRQLAQFENAKALSLDGKYVATLVDNNLQLWRVKGLNDLLKGSCDWLQDYFITHPKVKDDLEICDM
ncbi:MULTISPECIES: AAA-like domain-containing protein [unclassified Okeania]|uniref:WD40 domain-containing protein n=1 Tax=unclassified Okeania TaxID=2634635 RepID=UPI0013B9AC64|nr:MULTISPECIES: AAA-like domain-containing protein [unclassified Okeania]NES75598.1 hypothetical protein [Okeania sp. SIO1H4]NET18027.1 hypothetical protein [Okeania sp. SIO1H5]NET93030.1 hypothetical protein [Okeania sp. SIO1H2]